MRRLVIVVLALSVVGCTRGKSGGGARAGAGAGPSAAAGAIGHLAKGRVPAGWTEESHAVYDEKTIFDYIDGGADRFLKKGFRRLYAARYVNAAKDELTVDLYDLGRPENAAAIFADTRVPRPHPVAACDAALGHDYGLQLRLGRIYGEITVTKVDAGLQAAAAAFARAVCGK